MKYIMVLSIALFGAASFASIQTHNIEILYSPVAVDGNLTEWSGSTWIPMNVVYEKRTGLSNAQVLTAAEAYYSVKIDTASNLLYIAAKAKDTTPVRTNTFVNWNSEDHFEFFAAHPAANGSEIYYGAWNDMWEQRNAQHYSVGLNTAGNATWATMQDDTVADAKLPAAFMTAGSFDGTWQYVEAVIPLFQEYGGYVGTTNPGALLGEGDLVGFDVLYVTANSSYPDKFEGRVANNAEIGKFYLPGSIARHEIVTPEPLTVALFSLGALLIRRK